MKLGDFLKNVDWKVVVDNDITAIIPLKNKEKNIRESEIDDSIGVIFDYNEDFTVRETDLYGNYGIRLDDVVMYKEYGLHYILDINNKPYIVIWK